jgi:transcriptional regulator with XRE-family HTH domain
MISPSQCRAARGLLKWTQPKLADESGIGLSTINRYENETRPLRETAILRIKATLEDAGVEFIPASSSNGAGVRLKTD